MYAGTPTVRQSAAFLASYESVALARWSAADRREAWAAGLWVRLFDAKKDLLAGRHHGLTSDEVRARRRLAVTG